MWLLSVLIQKPQTWTRHTEIAIEQSTITSIQHRTTTSGEFSMKIYGFIFGSDIKVLYLDGSGVDVWVANRERSVSERIDLKKKKKEEDKCVNVEWKWENISNVEFEGFASEKITTNYCRVFCRWGRWHDNDLDEWEWDIHRELFCVFETCTTAQPIPFTHTIYETQYSAQSVSIHKNLKSAVLHVLNIYAVNRR